MRQKHQRFSQEEIISIRKLTDEGKSLNHISALFSVGKPSIYYQVRKFKPRIKKDFVVNLNDFQIGELIGAFAGDGNYFHEKYDPSLQKRSSHYRIRYFLTYATEGDYANYLSGLLKNLNLNPSIWNRDNSVLIVCVNSKEYIEFIKNYLIWEKDKTFTIRLRKEISQYSEDFLRGFARGLMDTDGFLNPGNAVCACISEQLINNLSKIFEHFNLNITRTVVDKEGNARPLHFVRVRRMSLIDYQKIIGFSSQNKINQLAKLLEKRISKD